MIQDILTYSTGAIAVAIILYRLIRVWRHSANGDSPCAGCSGSCSLHKTDRKAT